jgi:hypothetical protein
MNQTESAFSAEVAEHPGLKQLSCFDKLRNESFDLLINERRVAVICDHVYARLNPPLQYLLVMDVIGPDIDLDAVDTKWINFSGVYYPPRIEKIDTCGPISKYKIKAILPDAKFWK